MKLQLLGLNLKRDCDKLFNFNEFLSPTDQEDMTRS